MSFYVKNHILIGVAVEQFIGREAETATFQKSINREAARSIKTSRRLLLSGLVLFI